MGKFTGKAFMFYENFSKCECKLFFTFVQYVKKIRDKMLYKSCSHWPASVKKPPSSPSLQTMPLKIFAFLWTVYSLLVVPPPASLGFIYLQVHLYIQITADVVILKHWLCCCPSIDPAWCADYLQIFLNII